MRYHLRTLVIVSMVGPPLLAGVWWAGRWSAAHAYELRVLALVIAMPIFAIVFGLARLVAIWCWPDRDGGESA